MLSGIDSELSSNYPGVIGPSMRRVSMVAPMAIVSISSDVVWPAWPVAGGQEEMSVIWSEGEGHPSQDCNYTGSLSPRDHAQ